jgi:Ethanolamine utilization protein EutJ (predicted chaperonin)
VVAARLDWQKLSQDGVNVNALTSERLTDIGGGATFYSTLVEVAKVAIEAAGAAGGDGSAVCAAGGAGVELRDG